MSQNSLDSRLSKSVLLHLLDEGEVLKTNLQGIVSNLYSLNTLLKGLRDDGLINIKAMEYGKNIQKVSLTPKGIAVAKLLKKADDIVANPVNIREVIPIELPEGLHEQILRIMKVEKTESSEQEFILNAVRERIERWKKEHPGHP